MAFVTPDTPNLADFLTFLSTSVQIPSSALPSGSEWPGYAFNQIMALILQPPGASGITYSLAAYNGATHILFEITPDQAGQTYFADARGKNGYGLIVPSTGLVNSSSDQGTAQTLATPDWAKDMTVDALEFYKTPWGRQFLAWQQAYGPTVWVLT